MVMFAQTTESNWTFFHRGVSGPRLEHTMIAVLLTSLSCSDGLWGNTIGNHCVVELCSVCVCACVSVRVCVCVSMENAPHLRVCPHLSA